MNAIIGEKLGMTQIFDEEHRAVPVTAVKAGPVFVTQIKRVETDGYAAIQIAFKELAAEKAGRPATGHFAKAGVAPHRHVVEVRVEGLPFGLGTHAQWDRKLDGRIAQAVMAVQAIKGVEIGMGFEAARLPGSKVHDPIQYDESQKDGPNLGFVRPTNNAGGLEAGMTNGQPLVVRAAKKPISTLAKPLESVNLKTKQPESAEYERSDVCALSAASVIVENVVAFEVACALVDKFGGDSLQEMQARYELFMKMAGEH